MTAGILRRTRSTARLREGSTRDHQRALRTHRRHVGLRARVTITFALGAALLSGALAGITYLSVRSSVVNQQTATLRHEAISSALLLRPELQLPIVDYPRLLAESASTHGSDTLLYHSKHWYASSVLFTPPRPVPVLLRKAVLRGTPEEQTILLGNSPTYVVGVPIPAANSAYFELFPLTDSSKTLHVLLVSLILAAVVTTLGGALVGSWAASRALRPLQEAAHAALDIAGGRLDTRLETDDYADLAVLTSAFNRMADRLQERIEREVRFTSDVNHELRSPLTTLAASLAVLEGRRSELPERSQRALDLLGAEVRRFRRLVDDLLEISRLDAGLSDMSLSDVPLGDLVERCVAATGQLVPIELSEAAAGERLLVDKRRFERILTNLVENARHYGGGATRVAVLAQDHVARILVEDHGPGVPLEERERIFDRFSRGASGRRRGLGQGTGLGLAIVAEHARILGGRVWVEENDPVGARFVVELPLNKDRP
ncbi:MAG: HAMP domain-containing sensor histidine kinase [Acidimicrobiales bacterium]